MAFDMRCCRDYIRVHRVELNMSAIICFVGENTNLSTFCGRQLRAVAAQPRCNHSISGIVSCFFFCDAFKLNICTISTCLKK